MEEFRDDFHDLINCINQVCVSTGVTADLIRMKVKKAQEDPGELLRIIDESVKILEDSNTYAAEAGMKVKKLKAKVYERLKIGSK